MALVVTLALLLLVTILILTFFSQATLNRQISFASAAQSRADNLSQTAIQTIVNDLREEMAAGSTITTNASTSPTYVPLTNFVMVPQRLGSTGLTNLVKMSVGGSNIWSGANYRYSGPIRSIAGNSTTNASANGRYLPLSSWFSPQLLTPSETNLMMAPDWVIVTRQGPLTNAPSLSISDFTNRAATNGNYVIGRYAYTVYDIGGLLDANVVGYPSAANLSASDLARKGSAALVAATNLPDMTQAKSDALANWRIPPTNYASTGYYSYIRYVATTNGFLRPVNGGGSFLTRQDLIKYAVLNGLTNSLPFLTSFSREKNTPSWKPSTPSGSLIDYAGISESASSTNRNLANVRLTDATALIKSRFDLDRLAWLTYKGPSASLSSTDPLYNANGTAANILKYFGLTWDTRAFNFDNAEHGEQWVYTSPDGVVTSPSAIRTLDQVASLGREPDFFELLKAGILSGSLGVYSDGELSSANGNWGTSPAALSYRTNGAGATPKLFNQVADYQVLAIGANILTQYTSDGYPQFIQTAGGNVVGSKSLPYEFGHGEDVFRPAADTPLFGSGNTNRDYTYFWLKFVIWNPYRNAAVTSTNTGPTAFRITPVKGVVQASFHNNSTADLPNPLYRDFYNESSPGNTFHVTYTNSPSFIDPTPLMPTNVISANDPRFGAVVANYTNDSTGRQITGIYLGRQRSPDKRLNLTATGTAFNPQLYYTTPQITGPPLTPIDLRSQYQDWQGRWRSYQISGNTFASRRSLSDSGSGPGTDPYTNVAAFGGIENKYIDPRDGRLGMSTDHVDTDNTPDGVNCTYRSQPNVYRQTIVYFYYGTNNGVSSFVNTGRERPGFYSDNLTTSLSYYTDRDGVARPGDGGGRNSLPIGFNAYAGNSRPLILNDPFHSVGDIGYTYRDLPWKSLDFTSANSADAGLLDLFTLSGGMTTNLPVVAGKININSAPATVLQALLSGAATEFASDLKTVGSTLSASDVTSLVSALRPASGSTPTFMNKADLVSFFATNMPAAYAIKGQREAPIRALADVTQTRTWNLLIDVVAQAGRYAPSASGVDKFVVEGEKHYWLQVAIDRFTGEIVDQQLEPVYEQ